MREKLILGFIGQIYREFLRGLVVEFVERTDNDIDNTILAVLDLIFNYQD